MMDIKHCLLLLWLYVLPSVSIYSQNVLTEADKIEIRERCKNKITELQFYVCDIVNKNLPDDVRQNSIKAALALFVGKGERWYVENKCGDLVMRNPVKVYLLDKNGRKGWVNVRRFLNNLYRNPHRYGLVQLQSVDVEIVDSIYGKVDSTKAIIHIERYAIKNDSISPTPTKITSKYVGYINAIETPVDTLWDAHLGDVYATVTEWN